jgi:branched-chain amino acid transport system permease protein
MSLFRLYQDNITLIEQFSDYAILTVAVQVAMRAGLFSVLPIGAWLTGAYGVGILVKTYQVNEYLALVLSVAGVVVCGWVIGRLFHNLRRLQLALATVAVDLLLVSLAGDLSITGGGGGLYGIAANIPVLYVVCTVVVIMLGAALLERGALGRTSAVLAHDEDLAAAFGINVPVLRARFLMLSCGIGALAGAIYVMMFLSISPTDGNFSMITLMMSMAVIGGIGSWRGAVLGAFVLTVLPSVMGFVGAWRLEIYGIALAVVVVVSPDGLFGIYQRIRFKNRIHEKRRLGKILTRSFSVESS